MWVWLVFDNRIGENEVIKVCSTEEKANRFVVEQMEKGAGWYGEGSPYRIEPCFVER